ncbi:hypothetical protein EDC04DRAFT_2603669 [Pisolithus marmoratus]|nr:hypothetical protein EDC04DRAFT_2603669 [Pisolithus marmoratus]
MLSADTEWDTDTDQCSWDGRVSCLAHDTAASDDDSHSEVEVWELEGAELLQSLQLHFKKENELLTTPTPYQLLWNGTSPREWDKAEKNCHLGYNGLSAWMK